MNADEHFSPEPPLGDGAGPKRDGAAEAADSPEAAARADSERGAAPKVEPPRLHLIPYAAPSQGPTAAWRWPSRWAVGLAAGLALIAVAAAAGLYDHARQANLLTAKAEESRSLAQTVEALKNRIDAIELARARDESADFRKVATELKAESGAARDLGGALAQLTARVDRIDHDQSARLDKLADRIDHEATARIADLSARLDKMDKKPAAVVAAAAPTPAPTPSPRPTALPPKLDPGVSYEPTGSIDRPRAPLRGYWLVEVQGGVAIIDGRDGPQQVAPGDFLPGAGRVQRIERRGQGWVVVTSAGIIVGDQAPF
jgi:vacuolar-type H+-ATPase subunit H